MGSMGHYLVVTLPWRHEIMSRCPKASLMFHSTFLHPAVLYLYPTSTSISILPFTCPSRRMAVLRAPGERSISDSVSLGEKKNFVFCHVDDMNDSRWISKDISEISRQWWRKGRKPELILWEFSTQVSNSLNSNQAQDACISIWVVHQRGKRKEIWAGADSGLKAFKLISFRKETISFVCTGSGKLLFWNLVHSQLGSQFCWPVNKIRSMEVSAIPQTHTHTRSYINIWALLIHPGILYDSNI